MYIPDHGDANPGVFGGEQMVEINSSDKPSDGSPSEPVPERIPVMQQILDNPFLLLFLGITIPTVLYLVWGIMEIASIPVAD